MLLLVRAKADPRRLLAPLRYASQVADSRILPKTRLMRWDFEEKLRVPRLLAGIAALMALLTLALTCIGIAGVVSYSVLLRTKEAAIRMALGAERNTVLWLLLRSLGLLAVAGVLIGIFSAIPLGRVLESQFVYLRSSDVTVYGAAILAVIISCGLAALLPAVRILRVNLLDSLGHE